MTKARDISKLLSTVNGKIAGENLDVSFENITDTGTEGTKVASGTTAERGSTAGQFRFNSTTGLAEYYDGSSWNAIVSGALTDVIQDGSPQLGGDLDLNNSDITGTGNINITGTVTATTINGTIENVVEDTTPQLGGDLDVNGNDIVSTSNADINIIPNGTGRVTLGASKIEQVAEKVTVDAGAGLSGTFNFDVITQGVRLHTGNNAGNWTLNFRGDGSNTLNSIMDIGESITVALISTNGGTAYYNNAVQIDSSSVTPKWQGGSAPTEGNTSSLDTYSYTIIKTADATFTVLASLTQFA